MTKLKYSNLDKTQPLKYNNNKKMWQFFKKKTIFDKPYYIEL